MTLAAAHQGLADPRLYTPAIMAQRAYLEANNGIKGLSILEPGDTARALELFRRDGFVVIANVLTHEQTQFLANGCRTAVAGAARFERGRKTGYSDGQL